MIEPKDTAYIITRTNIPVGKPVSINAKEYYWSNFAIEYEMELELNKLIKLYAPHSFKVLYPKRKYTKKL